MLRKYARSTWRAGMRFTETAIYSTNKKAQARNSFLSTCRKHTGTSHRLVVPISSADISARSTAQISARAYQGSSLQKLLKELDALERDALATPKNDVLKTNTVISDIVSALEEFFFKPNSRLDAPVSASTHLAGDITQLVVASSNLLRLLHMNSDINTRSMENRVLRLLVDATVLATDHKGLKFNVKQIAQYVSNFRFVRPATSPLAQQLLRIMAVRFRRTPAKFKTGLVNRKIAVSDRLKSSELGYMMLGLSSMSSLNSYAAPLIMVITKYIWNVECPIAARDMSRALYGLQSLSPASQATQQLLSALARAFTHRGTDMTVSPSDIVSAKDSKPDRTRLQMTAREIAVAIYGLKNLVDNVVSVCNILEVLIGQLRGLVAFTSGGETFTGREISMITFGLGSMSLQSAALKQLLLILAEIISIEPRCDKSSMQDIYYLKGLCLANAINGLKNMSSDVPEVRMLISALSKRIKPSVDGHVSGHTIRDIEVTYLGLRNMRSDAPEVTVLMDLLNETFLNSNMLAGSLDAKCLGNVMYGLRYMHDDEAAVRKVLAWLVQQLKAGLAEGLTIIDNRSLAYAFHGLRCMSFNSAEVKDIMDILNCQLEHHLLTSCLPLQTWEIMLAINCLKYKKASFDVEESLLQRTIILLGEALARSERIQVLNVNFICNIMSSLNSISDDCSENSVLLRPLVSSMAEHILLGLKTTSLQSDIVPILYKFSVEADNIRLTTHDMLPSHQLIADAIQGLHLLSRGQSAVELIDLFTTYLLMNHEVYVSDKRSNRPFRLSRRVSYIENYCDEFRNIPQNRFSRDQVLRMMAGIQCMHNSDSQSDYNLEMSMVIDRMLEFLTEQLLFSPDIDVKALLPVRKGPVDKRKTNDGTAMKSKRRSSPVVVQKDDRLSPKQLARLVMTIRDIDCSTGPKGTYSKIALLKFVSVELCSLINKCPDPETALRQTLVRDSERLLEFVEKEKNLSTQQEVFIEYRHLFQRCLLSLPYIENIPPTLRVEIFGHLASFNEKLDAIQQYFAAHGWAMHGSSVSSSWKMNWIKRTQDWYHHELPKLAGVGSNSARLISVYVVQNQFIHHFDADILVQLKLHRPGRFSSQATVTERIINVEIEDIRDYLNTEKARYDQMRDNYLSKYHDIPIVRGKMRDIDINAQDILNDPVFCALHEAVLDVLRTDNS